MEEWRSIKNYEGIYEVSSLGRVKRVARTYYDSTGKMNRFNECILKENEDHYVILYDRTTKKYHNRAVRSLVAESFLGLPYGTCISHIDRDISNSRLSNLCSTEQFRKMDPVWRDIPGWEGEYQASKFGEIRSVDRMVRCKGSYKFIPGSIRVLDESEDGYYQIALYRNGKCVITTNAHIFVAKAWIPNPENKPTVNHIDGNKHNNIIDNLEWATYKEQQEHVIRTGLRKKPWWTLEQNGPVGGDWNERQKVKVRCIETNQEFDSFTQAAAAFNCSASEIKLSADKHSVCCGLHFVRSNEPDYKFGVDSLDEEIWKDVPGYEGLYQISNMKRVKSLARKVKCPKGFRTVPEKLICTKYGLTLNKDNIAIKYDLEELYNKLFKCTNQKKLFAI